MVEQDPFLIPFKDVIQDRYNRTEAWIKTIDDTEGGLDKFSKVSCSASICGAGP